MSFEDLGIELLFRDEDRPNVIRRAVRRCIEIGCATRRNGESEPVRYLGPSTDYVYVELLTDEAIGRAGREHGTILLWFDGIDFTIGAYRGYERLPEACIVSLSIDSVHLSRSKTDVRANIDRIRSLTVELYDALEPVFVCGDVLSPVSDQDPTVELSVDELADGRVDSFWWLTGLNPEAVGRLGRKTVASMPTYSVTECDDGGMVLILTDRPTQFGDVAEARRIVQARLGL